MKKIILILFVWVSQTLSAQNVNIPDTNFKAALIDVGVDTNGDGEIQVSEAQSRTYLDIGHKEIVSLEGIQSFKNLVHLDCSYNDINFIDVLGLDDLKYLNCFENEINSLSLTGLDKLEYLNFNVNPITSIDLNDANDLKELIVNNGLTSLDVSHLTKLELLHSWSHVPEIDFSNLTKLKDIYVHNLHVTSLDLSHLQDLERLHFTHTDITSLILSNLPKLENISVSDNVISNLVLSNLPALRYLTVSENPIDNLDVSSLTQLEKLSCSYTEISSLDMSNLNRLDFLACQGNHLTSLDVSNQPLLNLLICQENPLKTLNLKNGAFESTILPHSSLEYVCVDPEQREDIEGKVSANCVVNSFCTFEPGGTIYHINGSVKIDIDQDGCDPDDLYFPFLQFKVADTQGNLGIYSTDSIGNYQIPLPSGSYNITYEFPYMSYFDVTPPSFSMNFPTNPSPIEQDICLTPNGSYNDLQTVVIPLEEARPGFDAMYKIVYANVGTTPLSGNVIFSYEDDVVDFLSASVAPDTQNTGELSWSFTNLAPFEPVFIDVEMNLNAPTETPPLNGGDILCYVADISPLNGDQTPYDNSFSLKQTVVNSYDPNDKTCLEGDVIIPDLVGEYVHYLIRFENTGSVSAINVVIKDVIDTNKFDMTSFVPMNASHDFVTRIQNNNEVEFIFEDINLPFEDAFNDGFVLFKIKTLSSLVVGDTFENSAEIYFDFNFPIITNVEQTTVDTTASTDDFALNSDIKIFPNPAESLLQIGSQLNFDTIVIYDLTGKEIQRVVSTESRSSQEIDVSLFDSGIYYLSIQSGNSKTVQKFLKI